MDFDNREAFFYMFVTCLLYYNLETIFHAKPHQGFSMTGTKICKILNHEICYMPMLYAIRYNV